MELAIIFRTLWRRRWLALAGVLAVGLAFAFLMAKPRPQSGLAWTRIVLDTEKSEVIHPDPHGADSLLWRGHLIADLLTTAKNEAAIARRAGIPLSTLDVVEPIKDTTAELATPLPQRALEAADATLLAPNVVTVEYGTSLPVISLSAVAPTQAAAARLAQAAADLVVAQADQSGTYATRSAPVALQGLHADTVSPLRSRVVTASGGRSKKALACLVLLGAWLSFVAVAPLPRGRGRGRGVLTA